MRRSSLVTTFIFAAALSLTGVPAFAQRGGGHGGGGGGGHAGGGGGGHVSGGGGGGMRSGGSSGGGVRSGGGWSGGGTRSGGQIAGPRGVYGGYGSTFRGGYGSSYRGGYYRGGVYGGGYYGAGRSYYGGRYYGGRYWNVAPIHYYRPYYTFYPRFSLGFGLWAGYPVTWTYPYYSPYFYPSPYPYPDQYPVAPGYSVAPPVTVTPNTTVAPAGLDPEPDQSKYGGVSFEITPSNAEVFVDGNPVGTAGQFTPTSQPLGLPAGRHHVEIRLSGYRTMSFDADIVAGQVIPYQGQMER